MLVRTSSLPDWHQTRIALRASMASQWERDGNLLQAVTWGERAAASHNGEPAPRAAGASPAVVPVRQFAEYGDSWGEAQDLARLYRLVGRTAEADALKTKHRQSIESDPQRLAAFYEAENDLGFAAEQMRKYAGQVVGNPEQAAMAWSKLADIYRRNEQLPDAAAAMTKSIEFARAHPGGASTLSSAYRTLASITQGLGKTEEADRLYQQGLAALQPDGEPLEALLSYYNHLNDTHRSAESRKLLEDYLSANPNLPAHTQQLIRTLIPNAEREAGTSEAGGRAEGEVERSGDLTAASPSGATDFLIDAAEAMDHNKRAEAVQLVLTAISTMAETEEREQLAPALQELVDRIGDESIADAKRIFRRLIDTVAGWEEDTFEPSIEATQLYAEFLIAHKQPWRDVSEAIEAFRTKLIVAHGFDSGELVQVLQLRIDFETSHDSVEEVLGLIRERIAFQEQHNGAVSEASLQALQDLARAMAGKPESLRLWRRTVEIADLLYEPRDMQRVTVRLAAASELVGREEADMFRAEAIEVAKLLPPPEMKALIEEARNQASAGVQRPPREK
jgi:tetratricopeptide (TPR) repeat protein